MRRKIDESAVYQPVSNAARITGMSRKYVYEGIHSGKIPFILCGSDYRVNVPLFLQQLEEESKNNSSKEV